MSTDLFHQVMFLDLGQIVLTVTCILVAWSLPAVAFEKSTTEAPCPPGYYKCETGYCIPNSFLCDGDTDCLGGSDEQGCNRTTVYSSSSYTTDDTEQPTTTTTTQPTTTTTTQSTTTPGNECFLPFQSVGGSCVFVDPFVEGSWPEMRYRCEEFGSVLLEIDEPNFFLSVVQFIKEKGLEGTSYWTGGRKDAYDDLYYWDGSRTNVTMGTPFWAIYSVSSLAYYEQEPDASGVEQCILLNKDRKMYFSDMDCDATVAGVVCQRDPGPVDSPTAEVDSNMTSSASDGCAFSPPYQSVGGKCIFVEPFVEGSWEEMRYRCEDFGGILLEMEDPNFFWAVVEYIIKNEIDNHDYWTGGRKDAYDDLYYWDGSRTNVTMGTPFWAIYMEPSSGLYGQEPVTEALEECVFLNKNRKLFFSATDCDVTTAGVICQLPQN